MACISVSVIAEGHRHAGSMCIIGVVVSALQYIVAVVLLLSTTSTKQYVVLSTTNGAHLLHGVYMTCCRDDYTDVAVMTLMTRMMHMVADAMEGPTVVPALIHAATLVIAGVAQSWHASVSLVHSVCSVTSWSS